MLSLSQSSAPLSEVETQPFSHRELTDTATEQLFIDQTVRKDMNTNEGERSLPSSLKSSSLKRKRVRFDLPSEAMKTPEPIVPRYRKLRCIDNDIKREKKRAMLFDAEEADVNTKRPKRFRSPPPSPPPAPEPIIGAACTNAENSPEKPADPKAEEEDESQQQPRRRRGPVYYHERLTQRDAATSPSLSQGGEPQDEELSRPSLFAPSTLPATLAAFRISDEDQELES